ncbi:MAG: hypothetical protein GVX78_04950 [Bacteroidetes bacterium]|nr:hypothetical protein [Bacteroidota bacterium]
MKRRRRHIRCAFCQTLELIPWTVPPPEGSPPIT